MDVALGVAVSGAVARLALAGSGAHGVNVIDQSVVDVADSPIEKLAEIVLGTNRLLTEENHRLTATRLCWTDDEKVDELRRALEGSGVTNVAVLSDSQAEGSTMRAEVGEDPTSALARGAALAAARSAAASGATMAAPALASGVAGAETRVIPAQPGAGEGPLAYSMAGDGEPYDEFVDEYPDDGVDTGKLPLSRRSLVLGNAVIAFAVIGLASLAVAVVVANRPAESHQPVVGLQNAAPGKFMPLLPTRQQAPVPPPPPDAPNAGFQGGVVPDSNGYIPPQLIPPGQTAIPPVAPVNPAPGAPGYPAPGAPGYPAPGAPGVPQVPNPNVPIPIPIPIPIPNPGWRPQPPPYAPPYHPPANPTRPNPPPPRTAPPAHTPTQQPTEEPQPTRPREPVEPRPTRPQHTMAPEPQHTNAPEPQHTMAPEPQHTNAPEPQHTNAPEPQPRDGGHGHGASDRP